MAAFFVPAGAEKPLPAVIVLGGSEGGVGGDTARSIAQHGFATLALAYFRAPGLPDELGNIPLEYFDTAINWLKEQPAVDANRIGAFGISTGGEAALLIASRNPTIRAVVAGAPSNVVWQGIGKASAPGGAASFSLGGKSVSFLPYDHSKSFTTVYDLYIRSFAKRDAYPDAAIPVEKINGGILLICGEDDRLWPSCPMSDEVIARLKEKKFQSRVQLLRYSNAGHGAVGEPYTPDDPTAKDELGGTQGGNVAARTDGWPKAIAFLSEVLNQKR